MCINVWRCLLVIGWPCAMGTVLQANVSTPGRDGAKGRLCCCCWWCFQFFRFSNCADSSLLVSPSCALYTPSSLRTLKIHVHLSVRGGLMSLALLGLISANVFNFTQPPVLSALLLILSASVFAVFDFALLISAPFLYPSWWNDLPFPLLKQTTHKRQRSLDAFKSIVKTFRCPKQQT